MYLDRKVGIGIDKLDEQWKLVSKTLIVICTEEVLLQFSNNLIELLALHLAVGYDALVARNT